MIDLETIEREISELESLTVPFRHVFKLIAVSLLLVAFETALYRVECESSLSGCFGCGAVASDFNSVFKLYAWLGLFGGTSLMSKLHSPIRGVVLMRAPLKVICPVVALAFVFVVYHVIAIWIGAKSSCDEPVNTVSLCVSTFGQKDALVPSRPRKNLTEDSSSLSVSNAAKVRHLISTVVPLYIFPSLHSTPIW